MHIKSVNDRWCVLNRDNSPDTCILVLPGRGMSGVHMARQYLDTGLPKTLVVGITPERREWYPMPNGPEDQEEAVGGMRAARWAIEKVVFRINQWFDIPRSRIAVVGFSAGAVTAIQCAVHCQEPFAAVISHGGAVLEPHRLPPCKHPQMPVYLFHNRDDEAFEWEQRFLPMMRGLEDSGHKVTSVMRYEGGHYVSQEDVTLAGYFLGSVFGYPEQRSDDVDAALADVFIKNAGEKPHQG